ncbi:hypothetical protein SCHPADRAFT_907921 [Schizopora paradoxa]|uniref:T6SS Phospholipase effector Tle1-like catalytic domain-containing protein n=1 Tax=Schizopora paradoxa TaxID=27342 RepID=A0A0H2RCP2_9AGAM|nr:hypothetical protein SCHPADRAFT_907921 [Schizopora paradoxa]
MPDPNRRLHRRKALNLSFDVSASGFDSGSGWMTTDSTTDDGSQSTPPSTTTTLFSGSCLSPDANSQDKEFPAIPARCESPKLTSSTKLHSFARRAHKRHSRHTSLHTAYSGTVIPPPMPNRHRTLVLCFDGTGDQFDDDNSNIVQFFSMLKKGDKDQQLCYYQAGIGTYTIPQIATPFWSKLTQTVDLMIANSLDHHVMGGYEFLMENYKEGDKICIFGFSRGAYTARALAGMIHKVGLLPNSNHQQVPFAYRMYMQDDKEGWKQSVLFKKTFSIDVDIHFVGVWDTVASVGLISRRLPFVKSNTAVKTFRHALSLDERRAKFKPNSYQLATAEERNREGGDFKVPPTVLHAEVALDAAEVGREVEEELEEKREEEIEHEKEAEDEREARAERKARLIKEEAQLNGEAGEHLMRSASPESTPESTDVETETDHDTDDTMIHRPAMKKNNTVSHMIGEIVHHTLSSGSSLVRSLSTKSNSSSSSGHANGVDLEIEQCDRCKRNPIAHPEKQKKHHHKHHRHHGLDWDEDEWQTEEVALKKRLEELYTDRSRPTDVLEVWFAGCHCDVGGGSVKNDTRHSLARIPLRWMIRQCFAADSGIQFQAEKLHEIGLDPDSLYPYCKDRPPPVSVPYPPPEPNASPKNKKKGKKNNGPKREGDRGGAEADVEDDELAFFSEEEDDLLSLLGSDDEEEDDPWGPEAWVMETHRKSEEEEEMLDALCPMYDQLELSPGWWLLECVPINQRVQKPDGTWATVTQMNMGRPRVHPGQELTGIKVHRSVKTRMEAKHLGYTPRLKFDVEPEWVD